MIPINPNRKLPSRDPRIPTMRSPSRPKPLPLVIWPASQPAKIPTSTTQTKYSIEILPPLEDVTRGLGPLLPLAVAFFLVLFQHCSGSHFFGSLAIASGTLGAILD